MVVVGQVVLTISTILSEVMLGNLLLLLISSTSLITLGVSYSYLGTGSLGLIRGIMSGCGSSLTCVTITESSSFLYTALISLVVVYVFTVIVYSFVFVPCFEIILVIWPTCTGIYLESV